MTIIVAGLSHLRQELTSIDSTYNNGVCGWGLKLGKENLYLED